MLYKKHTIILKKTLKLKMIIKSINYIITLNNIRVINQFNPESSLLITLYQILVCLIIILKLKLQTYVEADMRQISLLQI